MNTNQSAKPLWLVFSLSNSWIIVSSFVTLPSSQNQPLSAFVKGCQYILLARLIHIACSFTEVLEAKTPVLVDFWAPWCGYCRRIGPAVDALAAEYAGKVAVGKVNVDEQPELAEQFKVMTIPSLFVFQNGEHGEAIIAPGSKAQIEEFMRAQGAL